MLVTLIVKLAWWVLREPQRAIESAVIFLALAYSGLLSWIVWIGGVWMGKGVESVKMVIPVEYLPPPPVLPPPPTYHERIIQLSATIPWPEEGIVYAGAIALSMLAAVLLVFQCLRFRVLRRMSYRLRGIKFEAMMEGSELMNGKEIPACQVEIWTPGLLCSSFQGYGIRVNNFLVVPTHVLRNCTQVLLGGKESVVVSSKPIASRLNSDVSYIMVSEETWSRLGVAKAKMAKKMMPVLVSCTGRNGTSSGMLRMSSVKGMVTYLGSTVPGMSGAAYYVSNVVHGIHSGVAGAVNIGVTAQLITTELKAMVSIKGESPIGNEADQDVHMIRGKVKGWKSEDLEQDALNAWEAGEEDWAFEDELDYDIDLGYDDDDYWDRLYQREEERREVDAWWEELEDKMADKAYGESVIKTPMAREFALRWFTSLPKEGKQRAVKEMSRAMKVKSKVVKFKGQSEDSQPVRVVVDQKEFSAADTRVRVAALEKKVETLTKGLLELREKVSEFEKRPPVQPPVSTSVAPEPGRLVCGLERADGKKCNRSFLTRAALEQHRNASHTFQGESALKEDSQKIVKTTKDGNFLVKRSGRANGTSWPRRSPGGKNSSQFTAVAASQRRMETYLKELCDFLRTSPRNTAGPSSDTQQN
uniref:C2H2-type domain-containing protein n=1 Tax=Riboviria sp. TaxID=2585031 RepID=A0A8K1U2E3_9VIRU|nr:MAG: hypothetical protein 1 [Riboviria sp.]